MIIAVDFDHTLADTDATKIYAPNTKLIEYLIDRRKHGDKLILWTCREDTRLYDAIVWCHGQGLSFDAVNENIDGLKKNGIDPRKIFANLYIGDDCCNLKEFDLPFRGWK